jgi:O-antigen/teichoic acid export membrane protein
MAYGTRIMSIFTGLMFSIIVTRRLTEADFGIWQIIGLIIGYVLFPASISNYWVTRYLARGEKVAKTGLIMNLAIAPFAAIAYLLASIPIAQRIQSPLAYFLVAGIQVIFYYILQTLESIAQGVKPEVQSYGFFLFEVAKVALAVWLVIESRMGVIGAILAIALAQIAQILLEAFLIKNTITGKFDKKLAKSWLKIFWLPIFGSLSGILYSLDGLIVPTLVGSPIPVAYFRVPNLIGNVITYSGLLAIALYPKLLGGGGKRDVEASIRFVLMFGIPMSVGAFVLARPLLYLLNPTYADLLWILRVMIPASLIFSLSGIFGTVLVGTEKVELNLNSKFKDFMKSNLFIVPLITYVSSIFYILTLIILLYFPNIWGFDYITLTLLWAFLSFIVTLSSTIYGWILAKRVMDFKFPFINLSKYLFCSAIMAILLQLLKFNLEYIPTFSNYVVSVLALVGFGALVYVIMLSMIDKEFRQIALAIFSNIRGMLSKLK